MKQSKHGIRKAAILIASLDVESAESLLAEMPAKQANAVRRAADDLGDLDALEQNEVIDEFFRIGPLVPDKYPSGIELCGHAPLDLARTRSIAPQSDQAADHEASSLGFLRDVPVQVLAEFLEREHPQTIALVVSRLPSHRAADVLATLTADLQIEVARRLVDLDETDPEILHEVERGIAARLCEQADSDRRRAAGMTALKNILDSASPQAKQHILANLSRHDRQLAGRIKVGGERPLVFADLEELDPSSLTVVLHHAQREVLVLALAGARPELAERAFELFPVHEAHALRRALCDLGPTRLSDVEEAQREMAALAGQLESRGEIVIAKRSHLSVAV